MPAAASAVTAGTLLAGLLLATLPAPQVVLTIRDPGITESSGLTVSVRHPGVLWTHNDGGSVAQVVGVGPDGSTVARVTLAGVDPYDPEALAPGRDEQGRPALYLGDTGDNDEKRTDVSVFRFAEPAALGDSTVTAQWYRFTYPDGPHDAEALLVDPHGRIMIATKEVSGAALYRAPSRLVTRDGGTNRLTRLAEVPSLVTDGAFLPDGRFVLRTYTSVYVYDRPGHEVAEADLPPQPQGESVAADGGHRLLIGSEGERSQVLAVPVPTPSATAPPASSSGVPPAGPGSARRVDPAAASSGAGTVTWVFRGVGLLVLLAGVVVVVRRRRH